MPRIRQKAGTYAEEDFWREIRVRGAERNIMSADALGKATGVTGATISNYREDPGKIRVAVMRKLVAELKPGIRPVLALLGYSEKEIRQFAKENT